MIGPRLEQPIRIPTAHVPRLFSFVLITVLAVNAKPAYPQSPARGAGVPDTRAANLNAMLGTQGAQRLFLGLASHVIKQKVDAGEYYFYSPKLKVAVSAERWPSNYWPGVVEHESSRTFPTGQREVVEESLQRLPWRERLQYELNEEAENSARQYLINHSKVQGESLWFDEKCISDLDLDSRNTANQSAVTAEVKAGRGSTAERSSIAHQQSLMQRLVNFIARKALKKGVKAIAVKYSVPAASTAVDFVFAFLSSTEIGPEDMTEAREIQKAQRAMDAYQRTQEAIAAGYQQTGGNSVAHGRGHPDPGDYRTMGSPVLRDTNTDVSPPAPRTEGPTLLKAGDPSPGKSSGNESPPQIGPPN